MQTTLRQIRRFLGLIVLLGFSPLVHAVVKYPVNWVPMLTAEDLESLPEGFRDVRANSIFPQWAENSRWKRWVFFRRVHEMDFEPIGVVFYPVKEPRGGVSPDADVGGKTRNLKGTEIPMYFAASGLAWASGKPVMMSSRLEKLYSREYSIRDERREIVDEFSDYFAKYSVETVRLRDEAVVLIPTPEAGLPAPQGGERARRYEAEREAWILENPAYKALGLIYQPGPAPAADSPELIEPSKQVRHAAALLARLTGREVFVQPRVEKREYKARPLTGTREEMLATLKDRLDRSYVELIEVGDHTVLLVQK